MLWQDACELDELIRRTKADEKTFSEVPLTRAAIARQLASVGVHASSLWPQDRPECVDADEMSWLARLAKPDAAYLMNTAEKTRAWHDAATVIPAIRHAVANDVDVIRTRVRWDKLTHRGPSDWPQPDRDRTCDNPALDALRKAAAEVAPPIGPVNRIWAFGELVDGPWQSGSVTNLAVECSHDMVDEDARRLQEGIIRGGIPRVQLIPQSMIHPLYWDRIIGAEVLVWEREGLPAGPIRPAGLSPHTHHPE